MGEDGSSPLTRGKHDSGRTRRPGLRLIPAHAGKTGEGRSTSWARTAHPRSRGENMTQAAPGDLVCGSSPLTRGKRERPGRVPTPGGLIPAHAGKTDLERNPELEGWAHPRSRGENVSGRT